VVTIYKAQMESNRIAQNHIACTVHRSNKQQAIKHWTFFNIMFFLSVQYPVSTGYCGALVWSLCNVHTGLLGVKFYICWLLRYS